MDLLKIGDKIILRKSNNSQQWAEGKILSIQSVLDKSGNYSCKTEDGRTLNVYSTNPADDFCLADRKEQVAYLKCKVKKLEAEVLSIKEEIVIFEKYETEEDYVADKLISLMKTKNRKAIVELLKRFKKSDYL